MRNINLFISDAAAATAVSESRTLLIDHQTMSGNDRTVLPPPHSGTTRRKTSRLQRQRNRLKHLNDVLTSTERTDSIAESTHPAAVLNRAASNAADDHRSKDDEDDDKEEEEEKIEIQKNRRGNVDFGLSSTGRPSTVSVSSQTEEGFASDSTKTPTMSASPQTDPDHVTVAGPMLPSCSVIDKSKATSPQLLACRNLRKLRLLTRLTRTVMTTTL